MGHSSVWHSLRSTGPAIAVLLAGALWPGAGQAALDLDTWDAWKNIAPVAAVVISLSALVVTSLTTFAKTRREKRDELKSAIEKLLDLRNELNAKFTTFATEQERETFSAMLNTRRSIYLQFAEYLAEQLPYVTTAEWMVLGFEHELESNYRNAEKLYRKGCKAAKKSSAVTQVSVLRSLASAQMRQGAGGLETGRASYRGAIGLLRDRRDAYSLYTVTYTYRYWANSEFGAGEMKNAFDRLRDAATTARTMPEWDGYRQSELRQCARFMQSLTDEFEKANDRPAAVDALTEAAAALTGLDDDFTKEVRAQIFVRRARLEHKGGDPEAAARFVDDARAALEVLAPANATRGAGLAILNGLSPPAEATARAG